MDDKKKKSAGRPASYSADFFPHYTNHDGEPHIRHISRKWGAEGYMIYFKLLERMGSNQHHLIDYRTDEDKLDLEDQLRPAKEKTIQEILEYLITRQVLDKNLYDQGIIYSPFFVNTLSTLYSSRHCKPLIPEIRKGKLLKNIEFEFSTEKYKFSTVNDLLQKENPANKNKQEENKKRESDQSNRINNTATTDNESNDKSCNAVDSVSDDDTSLEKVFVCDAVDSVSKPKKEVSGFKSAGNTAKMMYDTDGNRLKDKTSNNSGWNDIFKESPFLGMIRENLKICKENLINQYRKQGRDKMINCFAEVLRQIDDPDKEVRKPAGLFISLLDSFDGNITDELRSYMIQIENYERSWKQPDISDT